MNLMLGLPIGGGRTSLRPLIRPSLSIAAPQVGQVATINNGLVVGGQASYEYQWWTAETGPIGGATSQTFTVTSTQAGLTLYGRWRQSLGGGKFSRWYSTGSVQIATVTNYLNTGQYEIREARIGETINGTLVTTPRRMAYIVYDTDPPGGQTWSFARSNTGFITSFTPSNIAPLSNVSGRRYEALSGGQGDIGQPVYNRLARADVTTEANGAAASDPLIVTCSDVPFNFDNADDSRNGSVQVGPGATTGSIDVTFTSPYDGGQPLTIDLWIDGALKVAGITDGTYTYAAPTDWAVEADTYNPVVDHTFEFRFSNANGSAVSSTRTSKVKEAVLLNPAPTITVTYDTPSNEIRIVSDQQGEVALMLETASTDRSGSYVQTNLTSAPAYLPWTAIGQGLTTIAGSNITGFALLATNTYYVKPAVRNSENTLSGTVTAASMSVTGAPAGSPATLVGGFAVGLAGSTNATTFHSISSLGTLAAGDLVLVFQANSGVGNLDLTCSGDNSGAYTEIADLFSDGTGHDTNFSVHYKVMGSTPDTGVSISGSADANRRRALGAIAFRSVNATPIGNTATDDANTATTNGTPPAISLTVDNWIVGIVGGAANVTTAYTAPGEYGANFWTAIFAGTLSDAVIGFGAKLATATGTYTPAAFTGGDGSAGASWASASVEIKKV